MEVDDQIQCKFPRLITTNGNKLGHKNMDDQYQDEEDDGDNKIRTAASAAGGGGGVDLSGGGVGRFYGWPSSRIVRVSRASGGKDRHSKVLTSKGLRDRRVRLSVNTAIQFYDLQDRLGYDQPSKAVEWLLKAAAASIAELPPMTNPFPDTPRQLSDEKRSSTEAADVDCGGDLNFSQLPQATKSSAACSSTSETSKGSGLSLSRSESRIKARERAKGRVAEKAEKEKEHESVHVSGALHHPISHTTSFTELLSGGNNNNNNNNSNNDGRHWSSTPMDYFTSGLLGPRAAQMHIPVNPFASVASPLFSVTTDHHPELHNFSFMSDLVPVVNSAAGGNSSSDNNPHHHHHNHNHNHNNNNNGGGGGGGGGGHEYNLNFTISSSANSPPGLAGFNRGTLQSNSSPPPSLMPHLQRFSDGSAASFIFGAAAPVESHHHQFLSGYDGTGRGLQLCYGDANANNNNGNGNGNNNNGNRHSSLKGKGKN